MAPAKEGMMVGSSGGESGPPEEGSPVHLAALQQFHTVLEKFHLAEAELARVRADLAGRGVYLDVCDEMHW